MSQICQSSGLKATLAVIKENAITSIQGILRERNHSSITFDDPLTNNKIDHVDKEYIIGYDLDSNTVQIEMNENEYDFSLENIKVEVLILMLQEIEEGNYEEEEEEGE